MAKAEKTSYIKIDGDRLREAFRTRGLVRNQVATDLGCGCAISNAIARGNIAKPIMRLLEAEYGITIDEVAPVAEPSAKQRTQPEEIIIAPQISDEQWERLGTLIKQSILDAFKEYL